VWTCPRAGRERSREYRWNVFEICSFGSDCKGGVSGSFGGEFFTPRGIAVDQATGTVYVVERGSPAARVQAFTADGAFKWVQGKDVITSGSLSDPGSRTGSQVCTVAADCKSFTVGALGGEFARGRTTGNGIAVVPTPGPLDPPVLNAGNVVVTDRGNWRVQELVSMGSFVRTFGWDVVNIGQPGDSGSDAFEICGATNVTICKRAESSGQDGAVSGRFGSIWLRSDRSRWRVEHLVFDVVGVLG
jgi:DNA-binding beta-propeller fold protein YncE